MVEELAVGAAGLAARAPRAAGGGRRVLRRAAGRRGRPRYGTLPAGVDARAIIDRALPGMSGGRRVRGRRAGRAADAQPARARQRHQPRRWSTELERCVERADLDPAVHVLLLAGQRQGLLRRLRPGRERRGAGRDWDEPRAAAPPPGSPLDPQVMAANHDPARPWDPMVDYAMMSRNVRAFMSLFHCSKPVVCKVHGFCVAGGTDMALCSDLLVIAADAKIGYPPARVWGSPTTVDVGLPARASAGQAAAVHRRLAVRRRGARVGAGDRGAGRRGARRADRGAGRRGSPACRSTSCR